MNELDSVTVARAGDTRLTLGELLRSLLRHRELQPLVRRALSDKVVGEEARARGLVAPPEAVQKAADRFRMRTGLGSAAVTHAWLARHGLTPADLEASAEAQLLGRMLREHIAAPARQERFDAGPDRYARARVRQLVVGSENLARELLTQVTQDRRDFDEVARENALVPSPPTDVVQFDLPPEVAEKVFAAAPGVVVGPFGGRLGFHLIRVESTTPAALDDVTAARIDEELFREWLAGRLSGADASTGWLAGPELAERE